MRSTAARPLSFGLSAGVWPTPKTLLVDLRGIAAFDRPGLGALVGVLRGAHPGVGRVRVCADQPALVRLLRAEGLDRLFPLVSRPDQPAVTARP